MVEIGTVTTWETGLTPREQAMKIGEEAMEVFSACEQAGVDVHGRIDGASKILVECADVVQAVCNLVQMVGGAPYFREHMRACERRNRERGRL